MTLRHANRLGLRFARTRTHNLQIFVQVSRGGRYKQGTPFAFLRLV